MTQSTRGVDTKRADEFTELLLDALYALGGKLMPLNLTDRPASYDKFPQGLLKFIQQYQSAPNMNAKDIVSAAFKEWRSWLLRKIEKKSAYQAKEEFSQLLKLQQWMEQNAEFFTPATLRHLRKSFYGRIYAYLYPRLALIMDFKNHCYEENIGLLPIPRREATLEQANDETTQRKSWVQAVADESFIREHFNVVGQEREKLIKNVGPEYVEQFQEQAIAFLLQNPQYFNSVFEKKS
jgi:hypothetical protein